MAPTRLKLHRTPEAAGYGFVMGVVAGTSFGESLLYVTLSAVGGAALFALVRRQVSLRALTGLLAAKARGLERAADIAP